MRETANDTATYCMQAILAENPFKLKKNFESIYLERRVSLKGLNFKGPL